MFHLRPLNIGCRARCARKYRRRSLAIDGSAGHPAKRPWTRILAGSSLGACVCGPCADSTFRRVPPVDPTDWATTHDWVPTPRAPSDSLADDHTQRARRTSAHSRPISWDGMSSRRRHLQPRTACISCKRSACDIYHFWWVTQMLCSEHVIQNPSRESEAVCNGTNYRRHCRASISIGATAVASVNNCVQHRRSR